MSEDFSSSVADDELAAFVDRVLRMKSEEDAIKADIREIYNEAKGRGYDKTRLGELVTHLRKVEKDASGEAEKEAVRDLYLTAYYRAKNKPHAHAYARGEQSTTQNTSISGAGKAKSDDLSTTPEHDAETGDLTEQQDVPHPASDLTSLSQAPGQVATPSQAKTSTDGGTTEQDIGSPADSVTGEASRASDGAGSVASIQPETANDVPGSLPVPAAKPQGGVNWTRTEIETSGDSAERRATSFQKSHRAETPEGLGMSAPSDDADSLDEVAGASASAAPARFDARRLRPNCQRPFACGGQGREHCFRCRKAMSEGELA